MTIHANRNRSILAFVHIEKAAGTTLNHILRRNFFLRYLDVRPMHRESNGMFTERDLRLALRINPCLECISGHSISPVSDLSHAGFDIRYITLLRKPEARYISQYLYLKQEFGIRETFEEFLDLDELKNFQTRKIAGTESLQRAKEMLMQFFLVGTLEGFDEFLALLTRKLEPRVFDPAYEIRNITKKDKGSDEKTVLGTQYGERIRENNSLDIELYDWVVKELVPGQSAMLSDESVSPLQPETIPRTVQTMSKIKSYADYGIRKLYYQPATGIIRKFNKLPYSGSY